MHLINKIDDMAVGISSFIFRSLIFLTIAMWLFAFFLIMSE